MPKILVMFDGAVIKEVELSKDRTTLGRRPYNDVVIDNLTVSGEHAAIVKSGTVVTIEDLNSTNGTYLAGKAVKTQVLQNGDVLEVGKYKVRFEADQDGDNFEKTMIFKPPAAMPPAPAAPVLAAEMHGSIKVLSGAAAGREMTLTKIVTTVGKPGVSVAAITQRRHGFFVHHVEGNDRLLLNGAQVGEEPTALKSGDLIVLAGTQMQFFQH
ncbi:MAG: FHA domain-containing protein [Comamonadaceae bacterium]|nr:FHA domain-containing protein [Comamonadaceae bacterium]